MPEQHDISQVIQRQDVAAFREGLPQGAALKEESILKWMEDMAKSQDFHEPSWHYARLQGIGGSEAIHAVQEARIHRGLPPDDSGHLPRKLALEKLLLIPPEKTSGHMLRGNRFEAAIVERLLEQTGGKVREDLHQAVAQASGQVQGHPWMRGQPDVILEMPNGRITLVDIKSPAKAGNSVDYAYKVQLHHYRRIMQEAGCPPDQMILGNFDWQSFNVRLLDVAYEAYLEKLLLEGGDRLWDRILRGDLPVHEEIRWAEPEWEHMEPEEREILSQQIHQTEERWLLRRMAVERAKQEAENEANRLQDLLRKMGPMRGVKPSAYGLELAGLSVRTEVDVGRLKNLLHGVGAPDAMETFFEKDPKKYDVEAMAQRLKELGEDPEAYRALKVDAAKAIRVLEAHKVPYHEAVGHAILETPSLRLAKPKADGEKQETFEQIQAFVDGEMDAVYESFTVPDDEVSPQDGEQGKPETAGVGTERGTVETKGRPSTGSDSAPQPAETEALFFGEGGASLFTDTFRGVLESRGEPEESAVEADDILLESGQASGASETDRAEQGAIVRNRKAQVDDLIARLF